MGVQHRQAHRRWDARRRPATLPYDYYTLLRFVVCTVTGYNAVVAIGLGRMRWAWC